MKLLVTLTSLLGCMALVESAYHYRGWRPQGPAFYPTRNEQLQQPPQVYGPPVQLPPAPLPITTPAPPPTTTTPRSREPTTPTTTIIQQPAPGAFVEDFETNPALAIANSYAFNRPIYIYNSFPYYTPAAYTFIPGTALTLGTAYRA